ncbi:Sds3-like-domain-containing protein [Collybia nuda]|uniref:Sds3-like-domain-containing protein n=1 Tax=Collybia nuda TaxID=64659 RepID=A0A9P5Y6Q8_9AGAR|nr:Sds3-like-domain-containing protein [Collybia nuda]
MAGSTISLDSLSSPSPSPSPPPEPNKPTEPTSAGLDSDSELSELTEEEQEAEKRDESKDPGIRGTRNHAARRGRRPSRRGGRRKTSSMVPAPMWGWAEAKSSNVVEEEEEEEMAGPPKAMEEEEDEEADDDEDDSLSVPPPLPIGKSLNGDQPEEEEEPSDHFTVNAGEDEESMSGDDSVTYRATRSTRRSARNPGPPSRVLGDDAEISSSEDEAELSIKKADDPDEGTDVEDADDDEGGFETGPAPNGVDIQSDNENETESDEDDPKEKPVGDDMPVPPVSPVKPTSLAQLTAAFMDVDVDVTAPPPQDIAPLAAAAAASSIMAGSTVIRPPSPTPSSSASVSRVSSRSPSPVPSIKGPGRDDVIEETTTHIKHSQIKDSDTSNHSTKGALLTLDMDVEIPEAEFDNNQERSADEADVDDVNMDDDLEVELDSDLQPAHRAQALDSLALIEIKFADLRERVYLEKMENLAWEETLVGEGLHPELIHLHRELSQRRDKRLELASHKRCFETENVAKRRRSDEEATWSWWMFSRDELQTDMISETNRKRRRLERERRVIERPQPARRLPSILQDIPPPPSLRSVVKAFPFGNRRRNKRDSIFNSHQLIYPELSTLSPVDITNDLDFLFQTRDRRPPYDLHRGIGINMNMSLGAPPPSTHGYDQYNDEILPPSFGSGGHRIHPPPFQHHLHGPPPLQPGAPGSGFPSYNSSGRASQQLHPPPPTQNHVHQHGQSPFHNDLDIGIITGPGQILPHHPYFGSQGGSSSGYAGGQQPIRRTPSPINGLPNGVGSKPNGSWMGTGMGMGGIYPGPAKTGSEWHRDGHRNEQEDEDRERALRDKRERERERDRDREHREGLERERRDVQHMQQISQQHRHPPPHSHSVPPGQSHQHITGPHHHHRPHHHHVVHHHHSPPQPGSSSGHAPSPLPPSNSGRSPHSSREYESGRSHTHINHNQHPTEIINLSSTKSSHRKDELTSSAEYRDARNKHGGRPASGPIIDDRDRPLAMPFVMPSTHSIQHTSVPPSVNVPHNGTSSPHGSWNPSDDSSFRLPPSSSVPTPSGYIGAHESHSSPGHFYNSSSSSHLGRGPPPSQPSRQNSLGLSPPRPRPLPPPSPSSSSSAYPNNANPSRSPTRFGPPPSLAPSRSPVVMKMRPTSPLANKMLSGPLPSGPPAASTFSPQLSGPGRTLTPTGLPSPADIKNGVGSSVPSTYPVSSRTASPLMPFPSPSSHSGLSSRTLLNSTNGPGDRDRERERHGSPRLGVLPPPPPSKMSLPQMVDGH